MPYVGKQPVIGEFVELDALTASATADYTLTRNSVAYYPETVNNLLVSINGVIQAGSTMSLSGNTLTVGATLSSSDVIDFVRVFGNVGNVGTPTDGSVTETKIGSGAVTSAKIADDAVTNAKIDTVAASKLTGALPAIDGSALTGIITEGTWTPILSFANGNGGHTLSAAVGTYQKIGSFVYFNFFLSIGSKGSASGDCRVGLANLGFTPRNTSSLYQLINVGFNGTVNGQDFEGERPWWAQVQSNDATLRMFAMNGNGGVSQLNAVDVQNNTSIRGSGMIAI